MAKTAAVVNIHEAKTNFSKLLKRVGAGEEIVIAKAGKHCARLVPIPSAPKRQAGVLSGKLKGDVLGPLSEEELEDWE